MQDYQSELQNDLHFYIETMYLWTEVEDGWEFPEEFCKEFEAWLKAKAQQVAKELMNYDPVDGK